MEHLRDRWSREWNTTAGLKKSLEESMAPLSTVNDFRIQAQTNLAWKDRPFGGSWHVILIV